MSEYEYKVVPAPRRSDKIEGLNKGDDPFSLTVASTLNEHGRGGWEYVCSERLPCQRRKWLVFKVQSNDDVLVFRRRLTKPTDIFESQADELARIRARRVRKKELVEFVQAGGRRIELPDTSKTDGSDASPNSAVAAE